MQLPQLGLIFVCAALLAGCTTSKKAAAPKVEVVQVVRDVVGTELIGVKGATQKDQDAVDSTIAGLCGATVYRPNECASHQILTGPDNANKQTAKPVA